MPVRIQNATATSKKIQVHKLWTKVYSQQGLTAMEDAPSYQVWLQKVGYLTRYDLDQIWMHTQIQRFKYDTPPTPIETTVTALGYQQKVGGCGGPTQFLYLQYPTTGKMDKNK